MPSQSRNYQDTSWMFQRQPTAAPPAPPPVVPPSVVVERSRPSSHHQISTVVTAAWVIGAMTTTVSLLISAGIVAATRDNAPYVWYLIPLSIAAGVIVSAVLTIRWTREAATRAWRLEDEDRYYRFRFIENALEREKPTIIDASPIPPAPSDSQRLMVAGYKILVYHLTTGNPATRPECEQALGVSQSEWNTVNKLLIAIGLKAERRWLIQPGETQAALLKWLRCVDIRSDGTAWVRDDLDSPQWRRITL